MTLPDDFQFSQARLQDFVDCPQRFYLRYVREVAWPAVPSEPVAEQERRMQLGQSFHRLVQQHLLGIPVERLGRMAAGDPDLARWWQNYSVYLPASALGDPEGAVYPEATLAAVVAGFRTVAKYDLLVVRPGGRATILDWKTSRRRPRRDYLASALQTRVYPYLLVRAGSFLYNGVQIPPERVEMFYWFADFPDAPERFDYDPVAYADAEHYLEALIERIAGMDEEDFTMTDDERHCRYCAYRSYCDRGVAAGVLDEMDEEPDPDALLLPDFDFEQIAEIEF